jgi:hypothetical protein
MEFCRKPRTGKEIIDKFSDAETYLSRRRFYFRVYKQVEGVCGRQKYPLLKEIKRGVDFEVTVFKTINKP